MKLHSYCHNITRVLKILCLWKWYTVFMLCFLCPEDCCIHLLSYILSHMKPAANAILLINRVSQVNQLHPFCMFSYNYNKPMEAFSWWWFCLHYRLKMGLSAWQTLPFFMAPSSCLMKKPHFMVSFILRLFMNPSYVTPMEEKSLEEWASGLCLKHFVGAGMSGAQGSQPGQTGEGQKMKVGCLLNSFMPSPTH